MSVDISRDRRLLSLTLRANEVEYAKAVEQAALIEQARAHGASQLKAGLQSFDAVKAAVATGLETARPPQAALDAARGFLGKLKGAAEKVGVLQQALESIELKRGEQLDVVQRKKQVKELLGEKIKNLDSVQERQRLSREEDALEEIRAARGAVREQGLNEFSAGLVTAQQLDPVNVGITPGGGAAAQPFNLQEARGPQRQQAAKGAEQPSPGSYAGRIEQLVTRDSPEKSTLSLLLNEGSGGMTAVEITRRGQQSLAVRLVAETEGERRRLWARREKLISALSAAGYNVERVEMAAGGRGES